MLSQHSSCYRLHHTRATFHLPVNDSPSNMHELQQLPKRMAIWDELHVTSDSCAEHANVLGTSARELWCARHDALSPSTCLICRAHDALQKARSESRRQGGCLCVPRVEQELGLALLS